VGVFSEHSVYSIVLIGVPPLGDL